MKTFYFFNFFKEKSDTKNIFGNEKVNNFKTNKKMFEVVCRVGKIFNFMPNKSNAYKY